MPVIPRYPSPHLTQTHPEPRWRAPVQTGRAFLAGGVCFCTLFVHGLDLFPVFCKNSHAIRRGTYGKSSQKPPGAAFARICSRSFCRGCGVSDTDTCALAEKSTKPAECEQMVLDILIAAHRNNIAPLTAVDIRERLEMIHAPRRYDKGWVTSRLDSLRKKGAVEKSEESRLNPMTKRTSHLWFIPAQQARLCA